MGQCPPQKESEVVVFFSDAHEVPMLSLWFGNTYQKLNCGAFKRLLSIMGYLSMVVFITECLDNSVGRASDF